MYTWNSIWIYLSNSGCYQIRRDIKTYLHRALHVKNDIITFSQNIQFANTHFRPTPHLTYGYCSPDHTWIPLLLQPYQGPLGTYTNFHTEYP